MTLQNSVVLVSGGSEGIGRACAVALRRRGASVSTCALPGALWALPGDDADLQCLEGDVTDAAFRQFWINSAVRRFGRIDGLINNAAVGLYAPPTAAPLDQVRRLFEVNVFAPLAMTQLLAPLFRANGGGFVVNIGSVGGKVSLPWAALYCASKFALHAINDSLRRELSADGVHVMKVCAGIVDTRFRDHVLSGIAPDSVTEIRRIVSPEQVADALVQGIARRARTVYVPRIGKLFTTLEEVSSRTMDWYLRRKWKTTGSNSVPSPTFTRESGR